ncbi:MutH/Sau3AI family endonuclease [Bacillus toyonensis]|uniref:MutH/Sau3AI family endonuclease n=1 Tax=Bacillus toyonensis TaxID=155322 RepID=UPI0015CF1E33|nr:MutH/Sau3AI family endonuclease [Bacillus toyonensis]
MEANHVFTKQEILEMFDAIVDKTLGEIDKNKVFEYKPKNKGIAGHVIEKSVLGYPLDSKPRPDIVVDGIDIEVKTTGLKLPEKLRKDIGDRTLTAKEKKNLIPKERMSVTGVFLEEADITQEEFDESHLWSKLEHLLFVYYFYNSKDKVSTQEYKKFFVQGYHFYDMTPLDKKRIKNDWNIVRDFIIKQKIDNPDNPEVGYPQISRLTENMMVMDTAPKWPNKPRFRLKETFLKEIIHQHFDKNPHIRDSNVTSFTEFDNILHAFSEKYKGKSLEEIMIDMNLNINDNKGIIERVMAKYFGSAEAKLKNIELFSKVGIIPKSITLSVDGKRTEDTKFSSVNFDDWTNASDFEESDIFSYFSDHNFVFLIFEEAYKDSPLKKNKFVGFKRLIFDEEFINSEIKKLWKRTKELVDNKKLEEIVYRYKRTNEIIYNKNGKPKTYLNFPKSTEGKAFLRGTGTDSSRKPEEVNGIKMYKQYFWLRGDFMVSLLDKRDFI